MTLRVRLAGALAAVALGVGAFSAVVSYLTTSSQIVARIDDSLRSSAATANAPTSQPRSDHHNEQPGGADAGACPDAAAVAPASAAQLVAADGTVTACVTGAPVLPVRVGREVLTDGATHIDTVTIEGSGYRLLSTPSSGGGTLQIARGLGESQALLDRLRLQLIASIAVAAAVAAALGWLIATRLTQPITRLRTTAHRIATTLDYSTPVDVRASGEVGDLAASFSAMVDAVSRSQEQQRRLVADASHEMRTPLTSLRSNLDLIGRLERLPPAERNEVVVDVLADVDELTTLMVELVDLASDLAASEPTEVVDLADLATTVAARTLRRQQRQVHVEAEGTSTVIGRPRQLERAINNLIDNAVKYSPHGSPVEVLVDGTTVTVLDRGAGVPSDDLGRIFDRFYRATASRAQPGSGLGLAIVDEIVRSHDGTVFARNRSEGGAAIGFTLPATRA